MIMAGGGLNLGELDEPTAACSIAVGPLEVSLSLYREPAPYEPEAVCCECCGVVIAAKTFKAGLVATCNDCERVISRGAALGVANQEEIAQKLRDLKGAEANEPN
jgi:hypothetical protein